MTSTYNDLLAQRDALNEKIEQARTQELDAALSQIRTLMEQYGITAQEIMPRKTKSLVKHPRGKVEPKYRNPETGATWTGRGKPPLWIADKERDSFLINKD